MRILLTPVAMCKVLQRQFEACIYQHRAFYNTRRPAPSFKDLLYLSCAIWNQESGKWRQTRARRRFDPLCQLFVYFVCECESSQYTLCCSRATPRDRKVGFVSVCWNVALFKWSKMLHFPCCWCWELEAEETKEKKRRDARGMHKAGRCSGPQHRTSSSAELFAY